MHLEMEMEDTRTFSGPTGEIEGSKSSFGMTARLTLTNPNHNTTAAHNMASTRNITSVRNTTSACNILSDHKHGQDAEADLVYSPDT